VNALKLEGAVICRVLSIKY